MAAVLVSLIAFLFPLAYSPGPGNMVFAATGARFGLRATIPLSLGYHLATWGVTVAIGLGFAEAQRNAPLLLETLRWAGAAYVLYLAWRFFRAGAAGGGKGARAAGLRDGAMLLLLNPKAYVIIALMFTQFLGAVPLGPLASVLVIATVFTLNNLLAFVVWSAIGDRLAALFRDAASARRMNRVFGAVLAGVALWMVVG